MDTIKLKDIDDKVQEITCDDSDYFFKIFESLRIFIRIEHFRNDEYKQERIVINGK